MPEETQALVDSATCFICLNPNTLEGIDTYLLATLAGVEPDPQALAELAKCFICLPPNVQNGIDAYLEAVWADVEPDPEALAELSECFACLSPQIQAAIDTYSLANLAENTDPQSLADLAECFICLNPRIRNGINTYLLTVLAGVEADPDALTELAVDFIALSPKTLSAMSAYLASVTSVTPESAPVLSGDEDGLLAWTWTEADPVSWVIEREDTPGNWVVEATVGGAVRSAIPGVPGDNYRVVGINDSTGVSNVVVGPPRLTASPGVIEWVWNSTDPDSWVVQIWNGVFWTDEATLAGSARDYDPTVIGSDYRVIRVVGLDVAQASNAETSLVLVAPSGLTATPVSMSAIDLQWTDNTTGETGFKIERKLGVGGTYAQIDTVAADVTTYSDTGLSSATEYFYRVRAYNTGSNSAYSNENSATTLPRTAVDDFNRANANPISNPMSDGINSWASGCGALADMQIVNSAQAAGQAGSSSGARVAGAAWNPNQEASAFFASTIGPGLVLRMASDTDADCYLIQLMSSTTIDVYRMADTGSIGATKLGASITVTAVGATVLITARIVGDTITVYRDGVLVGTRTDATYTAGNPGIWAFGTAGIADWSATEIP